MIKPGIDAQALIDQFAKASASGSEQLRQAVHDATLRAIQGRELSLKNIRSVIGQMTQAAGAGAAQGGAASQVETLLDNAVAGMDDALLKAVEANRVALQRLMEQGVSVRETHVKKALADLEKMEDTMLAAVTKAASTAGAPLAGPWAQVLEKFNLSGTKTGSQAAGTVEQLLGQVQDTLRETRAASLKAAQTLAESYTALVSGVLIGLSDAVRQGAPDTKSSRKK